MSRCEMAYQHVEAGWYVSGDTRIWMKSKWERNYCHYLEWLKSIGEIADWEYEPDEFEFPIKRGTKFYKPDFKITNNDDGSVEYHEVKGHWTQKARTQVNRFRKYYPDLKLIVIDKDAYYAIAEKSVLIPNWEE